MQRYNLAFEIDGQQVPAPENWKELSILMVFDEDSVESEINVDSFQFANDGADIVEREVAKGQIFKGLPFKITISSALNTMVLPAFLNLSTYKRIQPGLVQVGIGRIITLNDVETRLQAITFGLLKEEGYITDADYIGVPYVVEKEFNGTDFAILALTTYLMSREVYSLAMSITKDAGAIAGILVAGIGGSVGSTILAVAVLAANIAFAALMLIAVMKLYQEIFEQIFPPEREHKGITYRKALEKMFQKIGYSFSSPIADLDWIYVPSKSQFSPRVNEGIPSVQDNGYICAEMLATVKKMTNSKLNFDDVANTVELRTKSDPFWLQNSNYLMPSTLDEEIEYNASDMKSTRVVYYSLDPVDYWTREDYLGNAYEVTVSHITPPTEPYLNLLKGLDEIKLPLARCVRKDSLSDIEKALKSAASIFDSVVKLFGGNISFANRIKNRVGLLKQGTRYHSIPKNVILVGNRIPADYKDRISARYIDNTYTSEKSLVANNFFGQKIPKRDRTIAMTFDEAMEVRKNRVFSFAGNPGRQGEFLKVRFFPDDDVAQCDFNIRQVYTRDLKETAIEPV